MPEAIQTPEETEPKRRPQFYMLLTDAEEIDLNRRAGEVQVITGQRTTVQDYVRSILWPAGDPE